MFQVKKLTSPDAGPEAFECEFEGMIDQTVKFAQLLAIGEGSPVRKLRIHAPGVISLNSIAVKEWINYFNGARERGIALSFVACSPAIVYQMNLFANFIRKTEVETIQLPYLCGACHEEILVERTPKEVEALGIDPPAIPCPKCGKNAEFDDIAEEYFSFLQIG